MDNTTLKIAMAAFFQIDEYEALSKIYVIIRISQGRQTQTDILPCRTRQGKSSTLSALCGSIDHRGPAIYADPPFFLPCFLTDQFLFHQELTISSPQR